MPRFLPVVSGVVLAALLALSFLADWRNLGPNGSIDLRNRVTGVRLLWAEKDPYHYKWAPGDPEGWWDPHNRPSLPTTWVTVTPPMLLCHQPVAAVPYPQGRYLWLGLQWACLLSILGAGWWMCGKGKAGWLWALAVLVFTCTANWRLHAERGQSYVVLAALLAWWVALTRHPRWGNTFRTGLVAGLLVAFRLPFLMLVPFVAWKYRRQLGGMAAVLVVAVGLTWLINPSCWNDYSRAMGQWSETYRSGVNPPPGLQVAPGKVVEGMDRAQMGRFSAIPFADSSLFQLFRGWGWAPLPSWPFLLVLLVVLGAWLWAARKQEGGVLVLGYAGWCFAADFFLPALRNTYNDVLILALLAPILAAAWPRREKAAKKNVIPRGPTWARAAFWVLAAALFAGWWVLEAQPRARASINLPTFGFVIICLLAWLGPLRPPRPAAAPAPAPGRKKR